MKLGRIVYICWWQLTKIKLFLNQFCTKKTTKYTSQGNFFSFLLFDKISTAQPCQTKMHLTE